MSTQEHGGPTTAPLSATGAAPKNITDPEKKRATYGTRYPLDDLKIVTKADVGGLPKEGAGDQKCLVRGRRITITVQRRSFPETLFGECNFHDQRGAGLAKIERVTFRGSGFDRCFMGTTRYVGVRFQDCTFTHCDFADAEFEDCLFERCTFKQCTGERARFQKTEVDPTAFLSGLECPLYNYRHASDPERNTVERDWPEIRLRVAAQLFRSNCEVLNTDLSDRGLYELKRAEVAYERQVWRARRKGKAPYADRATWHAWAAMQVKALNVKLTAGGTSLRNLAVVLLAAVLITPVLLGSIAVTYQGTTYAFSGWSASSVETYFRLLAPAAALILAYGFGNFSFASAGATAIGVAVAGFGLAWFAVLIPVLIRKMYR